MRACRAAIAIASLCAVLTACGPQPGANLPSPGPDSLPEPSLTPMRAGGKALLMHYMPWYETPDGRGSWGVHWTGHERQHNPEKLKENNLPDIWSKFHPLIGLYDSADPHVLECQLLQMKLAGVDGVIVDWYGIGQAADYPPIHFATQALFEKAGKTGMAFAVCYEDRSAKYMAELGKLDNPHTHLAETFRWMDKEWFDKPQYFRLDGRPLVLNFGPMFYTGPEAWAGAVDGLAHKPALFGLHHLWKSAGMDGGFSWVHWEAWEGTPTPDVTKRRLRNTYTGLSKEPSKLIVSAYPGFNDVYAERHRELAHRDGETLRESLAVCMEGPWPVAQLVTWNDYGEGTVIEPTHEFGYKFLEVIQEARRMEIGEAFPFTAEDLRLPARLLALRRAGKAPVEELDRAAALLAAGRPAEARAILAARDPE